MALTALGIKQVNIVQEGQGAVAVQKDAVTEATSQTWLAGSLTYTSGTGASMVLNGLATDGVLVYGMSPDSAVGTGSSVPPARLFGTQHYPFDVRDRILEINAISGTNIATIVSAGVTWAGGGTGGVALAAAQQYAVFVPTSGTYTNINFLDVDDTTNKLFEIVSLAPNQSTADGSPRVWVKVIPTKIQG